MPDLFKDAEVQDRTLKAETRKIRPGAREPLAAMNS